MPQRLAIPTIVRLAEEAFESQSAGRVSAHHIQLMSEHRGCVYTRYPQRDDWASVIGFDPDPDLYQEVGFMVVDEQEGGRVIIARMLIGRDASQPYMQIDWQPRTIDKESKPG